MRELSKCSEFKNQEIGLMVFSQILQAVQYIHSNGIVHRDIKLENIIVDKSMNIKLADFGFATNDHIDRLDSFLGSPAYMAPEILDGKIYNGTKTDIFALGVVLFGLVCGVAPFISATQSDAYYKMLMSDREKDINKYWAVMNKNGSPLT